MQSFSPFRVPLCTHSFSPHNRTTAQPHNRTTAQRFYFSLLFFFVINSASGQQQQVFCPPFSIRIEPVLENLTTSQNNFTSLPGAPGAYNRVYQVMIKAEDPVLLFNNVLQLKYLNLDLQVKVNNRPFVVDPSGSAELNDLIPLSQHLKIFEKSGNIFWEFGEPDQCGEQTTNQILQLTGQFTRLFSFVVRALPGENITIQPDALFCGACNAVPAINITSNPPMGSPPICNNNLVSFQQETLGTLQSGVNWYGIGVVLNLTPFGQNVNLVNFDGHIHIEPNGMTALGGIVIDKFADPFNQTFGNSVDVESPVENPDGSWDVYFNYRHAPSSSGFSSQLPLFILSVPVYNSSLGVDLNCSLVSGRISRLAGLGSGNNTCRLQGQNSVVSIPGLQPCPKNFVLNMQRSQMVGCTDIAVDFTLTHDFANPLEVERLFLRYFTTTTNNHQNATFTHPYPPCTLAPPNCGLSYPFNPVGTSNTQLAYLFDSPTTPFVLPNSTTTTISFPNENDCLGPVVYNAEVKVKGGSACAVTIAFDPADWPICQREIKGDIVNIDNGQGPINYRITLTSSNNLTSVIESDACAGYSFCTTAGMLPPYSLSIVPLDAPNTADCSKGVSMLDALKIQRMVLGLDPLPVNIPNFRAADVNGSVSLSTSDVLEIRKLMLGITNCFPGGSQRYHFKTAPLTPLNGSVVNTVTNIQPVQGQTTEIDIHHIKVGDVDDDYLCTPKLSKLNCNFTFNATTSPLDSYIHLELVSNHNEPIVAFQSEFRFNFEEFEFIGIAADGDVQFRNEDVYWTMEKPGLISVAWFNADFQRLLPERGKIGSLLFRRKEGVSGQKFPELYVNEDRIPALVANQEYTEYHIQSNLVSGSRSSESQNMVSDFLLLPNPSNGVCELRVGSDFTEAQICVFDPSGRMIQEFSITPDASKMLFFEQSGLFSVRIKTEQYESVQKLIVIR